MNSKIIFCSMMQMAIQDPEIPLVYVAKFREIGVRVLDGGDSYIVLNYCPWTGQKLPPSLRDEWFNRLEGKGIDPTEESYPEEFSDERWYQDGELGG